MGYLNVANDLFLDVHTIFDSEILKLTFEPYKPQPDHS